MDKLNPWALGTALAITMAIVFAACAAALALPQTLSAALRQLQKGGLEQRIERASNRLSFSLIIAAIVIASSNPDV